MEAAAAAWREVVIAAAEAASGIPAVCLPPSPAEGAPTIAAADTPPTAPPERVHPLQVAAAATAAQSVPPSLPRPAVAASGDIEANVIDLEVPPTVAMHAAAQPHQLRQVRATWRSPHLHD
jgi:hypothetical protein